MNNPTDPDPAGRFHRKAETAPKDATTTSTSPDTLPPSPDDTRRLLHDLQVLRSELDLKNGELQRVRNELEATRARADELSGLIPVGSLSLDASGRILDTNRAGAMLLGRNREMLVSRFFHDFILPEDRDTWFHYRQTLEEGGSVPPVELRFGQAAASVCWARVEAASLRTAATPEEWHLAISDITECKLADQQHALEVAVLTVLNGHSALQEMVGAILAAIQRAYGFAAVGIRLSQGADFPYIAQDGFPPDFLLAENSLLVRDADGFPCREADGSPSLACLCGLVLSGRTRPGIPHLTAAGSFWTNDASSLPFIPPEEDSRPHPCNVCIQRGYASVALIPLREGETIVGLLQLNDKSRNRFTPGLIHFFERLSVGIGIGLMQKNAVSALHESERQFRDLLEHLALVAIILDREGRLLFCNDCLLTLTGWERGDVLGRNWFEKFVPQEQSDAAAAYLAGIEGESFAQHCDYRILTRTGEERLIAWNNTVLLDRDGRIVGVAGIGEDATERHRLAEQLKESERQLQNLIDTSRVVLYKHNYRLDRIEYISQAIISFLGYTPEEIRQMPITAFFENLVHPEDRTLFEEAHAAACSRGGGHYQIECRFLHRSGDIRWGSDTIDLTCEDGTEGWIAVGGISDITDRKRAERHMEELRTTLERSREDHRITELMLLRSERLASLGQLSSAIAHEIRQPLNNIRLVTDSLQMWHEERQDIPTAEVYAGLAAVSRNVERMDGVLRTIRNMVKAPDRVDPAPIEVNRVIEEAVALYAEELHAHAVDVRLHLDPRTPRIAFVAVQLQQIVLNLLSNARKALQIGERETKTILIETGVQDAKAILRISDNGPGIPREKRESIFNPFFSSYDGAEDMGMGLFIVSMILKAYDSIIQVEDNEWGGATFVVRFLKNAVGEVT